MAPSIDASQPEHASGFKEQALPVSGFDLRIDPWAVYQGLDVGNGLGAVIRGDYNPFAIGDCITLQGGAVCRNAS
jgi:hypothetical protein